MTTPDKPDKPSGDQPTPNGDSRTPVPGNNRIPTDTTTPDSDSGTPAHDRPNLRRLCQQLRAFDTDLTETTAHASDINAHTETLTAQATRLSAHTPTKHSQATNHPNQTRQTQHRHRPKPRPASKPRQAPTMTTRKPEPATRRPEPKPKTTPETAANRKPTAPHRITIAINSPALDALTTIHHDTHHTKTDIINRALTLYHHIHTATRDGAHIVVKNEDIEHTLIFL